MGITGIVVVGCNSITSTGNYEKTIADYVQTHGNEKIDLKFKALETKELKKITVADSLNWFQKNIDSLRKEQKESYEFSEAWKHRGIDTIDYAQILSQYQKRNNNEVLGIIVECQWQGTMFGTTATETDYFLFSSDGKRIIKKIPPPKDI